MQFEQANDLLRPGYLAFKSGYKELGDGKHLVAALNSYAGLPRKDGALVVLLAGRNRSIQTLASDRSRLQ